MPLAFIVAPAVTVAALYGLDARLWRQGGEVPTVFVSLLALPAMCAFVLQFEAWKGWLRRIALVARPQERPLLRFHIVLRRWISVAAAAAVGCSATLVLLWLNPEALHQVAAIPGPVVALVALPALILVVRKGGRRLLAWAGIQHGLTYPPAWLGVVFGMSVAMSIVVASPLAWDATSSDTHVRALIYRSTWFLAAFFILAILIATVLATTRARARSPSVGGALLARQVSSGTRKPGYPALRRWMLSDAPVDSEKHDLFGHSLIAWRIADRLAQDKPPSQALVGGLGAGKTTMRHLVVEALETRRQTSTVEIVPAELWPFETTRAAVEGVISSLIRALAERVNVLALTGLPASYADAVVAAGGIASAIAKFKHPASSPSQRLEVLDEIARAIGVRYVLWVEDLERFAVGDPNQDQADTPEEAERLAPIRALLHGLDQLESITVVTATTTLYRRFDLEKIARYVEKLPTVEAPRVRSVIREFRSAWLAVPHIDPTPAVVRHEFGWTIEQDALWRTMFDGSITNLSEAIVELCRSPRTLKQTLRRCDETWSSLAGEIDLDAILGMTAVRESSPLAFAKVEEHVDALRRSDRARELATGQRSSSPTEVLQDDLLRSGLAERTVRAVMVVVDVTFQSRLMQGFGAKSKTDYWQRFMSVATIAPEESDQAALRAITRGNDAHLVSLLRDDARSPALEAFAEHLEPARLVRLLGPLVHVLMKEDPRDWGEQQRPPGLIPLWRTYLALVRRGTFPEPQLVDALLADYEIVVPRNLVLAAELEHWLVVPGGEVPQLLTPEHQSLAKARLRELLVNHYANRPDRLTARLRHTLRHTLLWLIWGIDRVRAGRTAEIPFPRWKELAETILQAAELEPGVVLPQLAALLVDERDRFEPEDRWRFSRARTELLFEDVTRVLRLFERPGAIGDDAVIAAVAKAAQMQQVADQLGSSLRAQREAALDGLSNMLGAGTIVDPFLVQALEVCALNRELTTNERGRAIALLRHARATDQLKEPLLDEWLDGTSDNRLGTSIASIFVDKPEWLDSLCAKLEQIPIPSASDALAIRLVGQVLDTIAAQVTRHAAQTGVQQVTRCLEAARRFAGLSELHDSIAVIERLVG